LKDMTMEATTFRALVVEETDKKQYIRRIKTRTIAELPAGEVLVRVHYSSLNYKDALSAIGNRGVTRRYPHTPGIDAAGVVAESMLPQLPPGTQVIVSCYDLGMNTPGGFGEYIRVPAAWVMPCPLGLTLKESMVFGTAGFTAALSVERLLNHGLHPDQGRVLVTGATGGVGSVAVALLARQGFAVTAVSGKADQHDFLHALGAERIISRQAATDTKNRILLKEQWAGVVDTVGGPILATALKGTKYGGAVTCCGNVAAPNLELTVYPFILRGVALLGIDAAKCDMILRRRVWDKLAGPWKLDMLADLAETISLAELDLYIETMLQGRVKGRVVLQHETAADTQ
jgi:putative YhdH/YhfP family quinone oxidoreductase